MQWIERDELYKYTLVDDFLKLLQVFDSDTLNEFQYERNNDGKDWIVRLY
ncbi:NUDIX hydrolase [Bacillus andreraoultii]|nr:hypothetical protein [Bacillus andreraoultii]